MLYSKKSCDIVKKNKKGGLNMIAIGADHGGYKLKEEIKSILINKVLNLKILGQIPKKEQITQFMQKKLLKQW